MSEHMTDDELLQAVMLHLSEGFNRTLMDSKDGMEYARRFVDGRVVFVVSHEGIDVLDRSLGVPGAN